MPGIGRKSAERILAETGVEMEHFQNESRFSSWAGLVPECKESAGEKMSTRIPFQLMGGVVLCQDLVQVKMRFSPS